VTDAIRTPDVLLEGLPDFPWEPRFRQVDGLRLAHVDEGDGAPVVFWHGEPTWSFLWRKVVPPVIEAGSRVILPDLPGFGRSDKPTDMGWYSYDAHAAAMTNLAPRALAGNFAPGFYVKHIVKDIGIAVASAEELGLDLPGLACARDLYARVVASGWEESGTQALYKLYV